MFNFVGLKSIDIRSFKLPRLCKIVVGDIVDMKLRTTSNSIRLRLSQTDVRNFAEKGIVEDTLHVNRAFGQALIYNLRRDAATDQLAVRFENNCLSVSIPASIADDWTSSDRVGIEARGTLDQPSILVEKDFACLKPRTGDDDEDSFPHPEAQSAC